MNKTIWALAFVVLCSGMAFAIGNASATQHTQSGWQGVTTAGNIVTEGGNVSNVTLDVNQTTEKWAGVYGEVDGLLVLAEDSASAFMYNWTINESDTGEVCVSTQITPTWANLQSGTTAANIDTIWNFIVPADADTAAKTLLATGAVNISGTSYTGAASLDNAGWETVALNLGAVLVKTDIVFCVNITQQNNYVGAPVDYELMVPTDENTGITETYYFFMELS